MKIIQNSPQVFLSGADQYKVSQTKQRKDLKMKNQANGLELRIREIQAKIVKIERAHKVDSETPSEIMAEYDRLYKLLRNLKAQQDREDFAQCA